MHVDKFFVESAGLLAIAPYAANFAGVIVFGKYFENCQQQKGWTTRQVRQVAMQITLLACGSALDICGFLSTPLIAYAAMVVALFLYGAGQSGIVSDVLNYFF